MPQPSRLWVPLISRRHGALPSSGDSLGGSSHGLSVLPRERPLLRPIVSPCPEVDQRASPRSEGRPASSPVAGSVRVSANLVRELTHVDRLLEVAVEPGVAKPITVPLQNE